MSKEHNTLLQGSEIFLKSLMREGVDTIFGYPGGAIMPLYDTLYSYSNELNHILVRHEQGAVHAAQGYARATGKVGVCFATAGPGATNFITGITDARMDNTPIICVTAQVNSDKLGTDFFQEADIMGLSIPITKWSFQITSASQIEEVLIKAFYIATSGRPGPVLISFTRNAQVEMAKMESNRKAVINNLIDRDTASKKILQGANISDKIYQACSMLNAAKKPLIIAGQGVLISHCEKTVTEMSQKANIPVVTTLLGLSAINNDFKNYYGNVGMHGHLAPNAMTQEADVIISVGMRFSDRVIGNPNDYAPHAKIIQIDIDNAQFNRNIDVDLPLLGDAAQITKAMLPHMEYKDRSDWFNYADSVKAHEDHDVIPEQLKATEDNRLTMGAVMDKISKTFKENLLLVSDVGQNQMFAARFSKFYKPSSWITSGGLGTMGFGLPAAIGAKMGQPERDVVAVMGDGGFQMNMQELGTIMQNRIDVKIVILNNTYLGMVRQWQELFFDKRYSFTHLMNPDFEKLAAAYGIEYFRATNGKELEEGTEKMKASKSAFFLEADVEEQENVFPMIAPGASVSDIMESQS